MQGTGWWPGAASNHSRAHSCLGIPGGSQSTSKGTGTAWGSLCASRSGAETTALALQMGHLYFIAFKSQLPAAVTSFLGQAGLPLLHYGTAQPQLYKPQRGCCQLPPSSSRPWLALGCMSHLLPSSPPWEQHGARIGQCGCSQAPFLLGTFPSRPSNTFPMPSCKQPRWTSISSGPSPKPAQGQGAIWCPSPRAGLLFYTLTPPRTLPLLRPNPNHSTAP